VMAMFMEEYYAAGAALGSALRKRGVIGFRPESPSVRAF